ncbi:MAG: GtrA family protein [Synergistaceae bacterium]|nr:GtrA family protein [Synergistaceae bacterium]
MQKIFIQAINFFGISGIGWLLDFCIYTCLGFISCNLVLNNIISSWAGVTFAFVTATRKIFLKRSKIPLKIKYAVYILYQFIMIYLISILLSNINHVIADILNPDLPQSLSSTISKIFVTPVTMIINFIVMKAVIEKI